MKIYDITGKEVGKINMPHQFNEEIRSDLIHRAVVTIEANKRQPYGAFAEAGKRNTVRISKRRRNFRTSYGIGMARTPQKVMSVRGTRFNWVGAFAPNAVGGRGAHPPKSEKIWTQNINKKENRKAIRSAISATIMPDLVKQRGHIIPEIYPFILDDKALSLEKTSEVVQMLDKLGFENELKRSEDRKVRAGKGKSRGRRYSRAKSLLIVVADKRCALAKSAKNIPGVDVINAKNLNASLLAPGGVMGRATIYTKDAVEKIAKEKLFE
ncbi:MAG: 50S ribosomal protein L4 [Candidatus Woesearchaeota archaeon]